MNSKALWAIILVIVVIGGIYIFSLPSETDQVVNTNTPATNSDTNNTQTQSTGRVVFSVTDAAANMGNISEVSIKVNSVAVHTVGGSWTTVSTTPKTYNLLALKASGKSEVLADVNAKAGTYDQVLLTIDSVSVKTKADATFNAMVPSRELKINVPLLVKEKATSSVNFDFLADKSLHVTSDGKYIFAPVVKTESRSDAAVSVDAKNVVTITGGKLDNTNTVGMDIDGSMKLNFQINSTQKLIIGSDNVIKIQ
jgi:hypothetical protein